MGAGGAGEPPSPSPSAVEDNNNINSTSDRNNSNNKKKNKGKRRLPSPQELVSHYEKQGLGTQEASLKVIGDLQGALFRVISANRNTRSQTDAAKLDSIHSRLLQLEMKLDSKPNYPHTLALGVASAAVWNASLQLWNSIRRATSSTPSSSS